MLKDHNAVTPVKLEPAAPRSQVKHSTTEPLHSLNVMRCVKETDRMTNSIAPKGASDLDVYCFLRHSCLNILCIVKPVLSGHSKINKTKILMTNCSLMKVESIARSILQYFCPAFSDNQSWKPIFVFF